MVDTKFSKIVGSIDGSTEPIAAANYAIGLAKKDNAQLIVLTVLKLPSFYGWSAIEEPKESWIRCSTLISRKSSC